MAALCHFYPGYTLTSLREVSLRDFGVLVEMMNEALEASSG